MRMSGWGALGAAVVLMSAPVVSAAGPSVRARAAIVMDATTGDVLWSRQPDLALPPASTTKVMTALLAVESGRLNESFPVSGLAQSRPPTKIGLRRGQRMRLDHLLDAILLRSANDAAVVIAEGLEGSVPAFARAMTRRAHQLGARTARFRNPHGLTQAGHVASARDLATIFRHATKNPKIRHILQIKSIRVPVRGRGVRYVSLWSHNRLLTGYKYRVIGKTGYTRAAGRCFVGSARHDGREIVIALLGSTDLWGDARHMFEWAFTKGRSLPETQIAQRAPTPAPDGEQPTPTVVLAATPTPLPAWTTASPVGSSADAPEGVRRFTVRFGPFSDDGTFERAKENLANRGYSPLAAGRALRLGSFTSPRLALHLANRMRHSGWDADVVTLY
jgi:D-alanyl-D-alanine carboxypeptidase (penicillin-binding protein 5/6)